MEHRGIFETVSVHFCCSVKSLSSFGSGADGIVKTARLFEGCLHLGTNNFLRTRRVSTRTSGSHAGGIQENSRTGGVSSIVIRDPLASFSANIKRTVRSSHCSFAHWCAHRAVLSRLSFLLAPHSAIRFLSLSLHPRGARSGRARSPWEFSTVPCLVPISLLSANGAFCGDL